MSQLSVFLTLFYVIVITPAIANEWQRPATIAYARHPAAGGALKVGGSSDEQLPRVRYHLDVHIEDGFARTTIDQVYFNTQQRQLEGRDATGKSIRPRVALRHPPIGSQFRSQRPAPENLRTRHFPER